MIYPDSFEHKIGFDAVREKISEFTLSATGADYCSSMSVSSDFDVVSAAIDQTFEMLNILESDEPLPLENMHDVMPVLRAIKVEGTYASAAELLRIRQSLATIASIVTYFARRRNDEGVSQYPALDKVVSGLIGFPACISLIDRVIDKYGNVRDTASPELADVRKRLISMSGTVNAAMRRVMSRAQQEGVIDSDTAPTMRDGRLMIPVASMNKRKISGIVHDESASGKTVYIEPAEVVEANNRIRELQIEEHREIVRILVAVAAELRPHIDAMLSSYQLLGLIDFIHAKARYAQLVGGDRPILSPRPELEWYHAVHPVLFLSLRRQDKEVVPLDITLDVGNRILIISGPNAGGKSVCLKTVGIVQYMTQCGVLPPLHDNSHVGIFDDIFIDIGDDQSIEDDLSTYSSHLRNMKYFLNKGRDTSLVLIDEFGGGTEPQIGGAIAQAILQEFNNRSMWGVITTHYQNIKHFAEDTEGLVNGSMLYDRHMMQPLFKLSIGNPGSSFAVEIARKTGLPASIIDEAERIVGSDYINMDRYLLDIARDRRYWENKRMSIRQKEKKVEQLIEQYEHDAETLREKRRDIIEDARTEARRILDSSNASIERTIHDIRKAQADKGKTLEARRRIAEEKERLEADSGKDKEHPLLAKVARSKRKKAPKPAVSDRRPIAVGDTVKLDGEGIPGTVTEISGQNATVVFGMLKTTVKTDRLKHTDAKPSGSGAKASFVSVGTAADSRSRQLNFKQDIDVRGMRVDEAVQAITYFIDDAIQFNAGRVRILHGTGTGALRQYIRQYLDTVPGVRSYRDEHVQFGGAGITVVELE